MMLIVSVGLLFMLFGSANGAAQTWTLGSLQVSIQGHVSPLCDSRAGDAENMLLCSLRGALFKQGGHIESFVLPWETSQVRNVVAIDGESIVVFGSTQGGFEQLSIFDIAKKTFVVTKLAAKTSLSPRQDLIAYQTYQPPHGGEEPVVEIKYFIPWKLRR